MKWKDLSEAEKEKNRARQRAHYKLFKKKRVPAGKSIDHKDGNPSNNSSSNLRVISKSKNLGRGGQGGRTKGKPHKYPKR